MRNNHKWKDEQCIHCGVFREMETVKTLMAIHRGKDVYKYERKYLYYKRFSSFKDTYERPICKVE